MNKTILMGRLTKDPEVKYLQDENSTAMARYTLAVDRRYRKDGKEETDFISCVTFGKNAEFAEKYLKKGLKILVSGRSSVAAANCSCGMVFTFPSRMASTVFTTRSLQKIQKH